MRILMVAAEYAPLAKTGGLADMVTGLSRALAGAGHDVRVVLPRYLPLLASTQQDDGTALLRGDAQVSPVAWNGAHPPYTFRQLPRRGPTEPQIYQVDAPALFSSGSIYGGGDAEARRFALLGHAALRLVEILEWSPHIVHCHDWHAALIPVLLTRGYAASRALRAASSVLTIHNIGYQGVFPAAMTPELGLVPSTVGSAPGVAGSLNFLRDGIAAADALTTVSPTHAAEVLTPEYGKGLDPLLRQRRNRLVGILNGVDYTAWNPSTDETLPAQYEAARLEGKAHCRDALIQRAGLAPTRTPLLGMVTRLAEQKGIELVVEALPPLLRQRRVQLVILGQGEERYVARLRQMASEFPRQFHYFDAQDDRLARLIFAGSDAFLVPSIYEPCGLTQMYALRYGAVPVVRETGGLKDTVRHYDPGSGVGTGSVFKHADGTGLAWAIGEILAWYQQPAAWERLQQNGMADDFSWQHQAPRYADLYTRLSGPGPG